MYHRHRLPDLDSHKVTEMQKKQSKLNRFLVRAQHAARYVLPTYSSKFSRKDFTQHQLLAIAALKQRTDEDYRDTVDSISSDMMNEIGLTKIPHFTAIQKFMKRISTKVLDTLIAILAVLIIGNPVRGAKVAIDSSGYPSSYASSYYVRRIKRKPTRKSFLKGSFVSDTVNQMIICCKPRNFPAHDSIDFISLLEEAEKLLKKIFEVHADKGYDGENNISFVKCGLNAEAYIKIREGLKQNCKSSIRKEMLEKWNALEFAVKGRQRNLIETINSVVKKVFGDVLYSKNIWMRRKELKLRYFAYNVYRTTVLETLFLLTVFFTSEAS